MIHLAITLTLLVQPSAVQDPSSALLTVAESSDFKATSLHKDVMAFVQKLSERSSVVRLGSLGTSTEGRDIPLVIMANPPVQTAEQARQSGKMVVYAQGNIHAGEVCGKEALQMLARDIAMTPNHPLLDDLIIVFAPIYNCDGNEKIDKNNRRGQNGPEDGMGVRPNGQGYDLNRDNTKLESPEAQGLVRFMNEWDPHLTIDTHTTNGSYHQNYLTFDGPVNPAGDQAVIEFVRHKLLPAVRDEVMRTTGYLTNYYGNFGDNKTRWTTYEGRPRFGTRYRGIRGIPSVLTEAHKYKPYKDRILCTKAFVFECLEYAAANKEAFRKLVSDTRRRTIEAGNNPQPDDMVALRAQVAPLEEKLIINGWVEKVPEGGDDPPARAGRGQRGTGGQRAGRGGRGERGQRAGRGGRGGQGRRGRGGRRAVPTDEKKDYEVEHWGAYAPTLSVRRPFAYLVPAELTDVIQKLRHHGVEMQRLSQASEVDVEVYKLDSVEKARNTFQKHIMLTVGVTSRKERRNVPRGTMIVRTGQALGNLVVYLLEPQSEDGLTAWNFLDDHVEEGKDFPILRVPARTTLVPEPASPKSKR